MRRTWPKFERTGPPVTVGKVNAFEKQFGALPEDYYDFLIDVNGGRLADDNCEFEHGVVNNLFTLNPDEEHQSSDLVTWNERVTRDLDTNEVIVVGCDDGGGRILIALAGSHRGQVWLQIHDERPAESNPRVLWHDRRGMRKLADSFEQFMASLKPLASP